MVHLAYRRDDRATPSSTAAATWLRRRPQRARGSSTCRPTWCSPAATRPTRRSMRPTRPWRTAGGRPRPKSRCSGHIPSAVLLRTSLLYGTDHLSVGQRDVADAVTGRSTGSYFTDEYRCPAHAADVAAAILRLADLPDVAGPLHVAGPAGAQPGRPRLGIRPSTCGLDESRLVTSTLGRERSSTARPGVVLDMPARPHRSASPAARSTRPSPTR